VLEGDSSEGMHASLLYNMSTAVQDFYTDLNNLGIDQKVLSMTFTEFGRRAYSNESYGTDHGTATPVFVFGNKLNNGIYGENPLLGPDDLNRGNLVYDIDYRRIYTSIIQDWFEGDDQALIDTGFAEWVDQKIPIVSTTGVPGITPGKNPNSLQIFPNPVSDLAQLQFKLSRRGEVKMFVIDSSGRTVRSFSQEGVYGPNTASLNVSELRSGMYHLLLVQKGTRITESFIKL